MGERHNQYQLWRLKGQWVIKDKLHHRLCLEIRAQNASLRINNLGGR